MRKLNLPTSQIVIEKTGLPFYDAARLIGAAHRHFGTATVKVQDWGSQWVLIGPRIVAERQRQQLAWVLDNLPAYASSAKSLRGSIEKDAPWGDSGSGTFPIIQAAQQEQKEGKRCVLLPGNHSADWYSGARPPGGLPQSGFSGWP
jgi:hypothetical protein